MVQGWNKVCFTGGIVEIRAKIPGMKDKGGLWPAGLLPIFLSITLYL